MKYVSSNAALVQTWGALPAIESQRAAFFAARDEQFAPVKVDWTVSTKMLEFPDVPSHEGPMPNFAKADAANKSFGNKLWTTAGPRPRQGDRRPREDVAGHLRRGLIGTHRSPTGDGSLTSPVGTSFADRSRGRKATRCLQDR